MGRAFSTIVIAIIAIATILNGLDKFEESMNIMLWIQELINKILIFVFQK